MTCKVNENEKDGTSVMSLGQKLFCIVSTIALVLTFIYSDTAISAMSDGMRLCVATLIPSLFPVMVFSELFVRSGAAELIGRLVGAPISRLFGISRAGGVAWMLGAICGFPIGMKCAVSLYERGRISREELEHLSTFCNMPSSAFLIGAVGTSLFGSQAFGVILYASHVISCVIIGFVGKFYFLGKKREYLCTDTSLVCRREGCAASFVESVRSSAVSMLFICAFVVFFSSLTGIFKAVVSYLSLDERTQALVIGFFEMTGGVFASSALSLGTAIPVVAAITGWSGLSVHFQLIGICGSHKMSLTPYFLSKIADALICAALVWIMTSAFWGSITFSTGGSIESLLVIGYDPMSLLSLAFFGVSCFGLLSRMKKR